MILENDYLLIGCSERTTDHAFQSLKRVLFEKKVIQNLVQVKIPNEFYYGSDEATSKSESTDNYF